MSFTRQAVAAAALAALAASAQAKITRVTVTGTVRDGSDPVGLFGRAGTSLTGQQFTEVFLIDDSVAAHFYNIPGIYSEVFGGSYWNAPPPVSGTFTIHNHGIAVGGGFYSNAEQGQNGAQQAVEYRIMASDSNIARQMTFNLSGDSTTAFPIDLERPADFQITGDVSCCSRFQYQTCDKNNISLGYTYAFLRPAHFTATGAVPEPASWTMLITGFGLTGAILRRRSLARSCPPQQNLVP